MSDKKLVTVPGLTPKTQIFVDVKLTGKDLEEHFENYKARLKDIPSDVASTMWKQKEPIGKRSLPKSKGTKIYKGNRINIV